MKKDNWNLVRSTCKGCGKDIFDFPSRNKKYCSLECRKLNKKEIKKCLQCGNQFEVYISKKSNFCCYKCAMDFRKNKKRPKEIGRKVSETKLKRVLTNKNSSRKRAGYLYPKVKNCELCGESDKKRIDRHHKDFNPFNNNKNNIQFLCKTCHQRLHKNWTKRLAYENLHSIIKR